MKTFLKSLWFVVVCRPIMGWSLLIILLVPMLSWAQSNDPYVQADKGSSRQDLSGVVQFFDFAPKSANRVYGNDTSSIYGWLQGAVVFSKYEMSVSEARAMALGTNNNTHAKMIITPGDHYIDGKIYPYVYFLIRESGYGWNMKFGLKAYKLKSRSYHLFIEQNDENIGNG